MAEVEMNFVRILIIYFMIMLKQSFCVPKLISRSKNEAQVDGKESNNGEIMKIIQNETFKNIMNDSKHVNTITGIRYETFDKEQNVNENNTGIVDLKEENHANVTRDTDIEKNNGNVSKNSSIMEVNNYENSIGEISITVKHDEKMSTNNFFSLEDKNKTGVFDETVNTSTLTSFTKEAQPKRQNTDSILPKIKDINDISNRKMDRKDANNILMANRKIEKDQLGNSSLRDSISTLQEIRRDDIIQNTTTTRKLDIKNNILHLSDQKNVLIHLTVKPFEEYTSVDRTSQIDFTVKVIKNPKISFKATTKKSEASNEDFILLNTKMTPKELSNVNVVENIKSTKEKNDIFDQTSHNKFVMVNNKTEPIKQRPKENITAQTSLISKENLVISSQQNSVAYDKLHTNPEERATQIEMKISSTRRFNRNNATTTNSLFSNSHNIVGQFEVYIKHSTNNMSIENISMQTVLNEKKTTIKNMSNFLFENKAESSKNNPILYNVSHANINEMTRTSSNEEIITSEDIRNTKDLKNVSSKNDATLSDVKHTFTNVTIQTMSNEVIKKDKHISDGSINSKKISIQISSTPFDIKNYENSLTLTKDADINNMYAKDIPTPYDTGKINSNAATQTNFKKEIATSENVNDTSTISKKINTSINISYINENSIKAESIVNAHNTNDKNNPLPYNTNNIITRATIQTVSNENANIVEDIHDIWNNFSKNSIVKNNATLDTYSITHSNYNKNDLIKHLDKPRNNIKYVNIDNNTTQFDASSLNINATTISYENANIVKDFYNTFIESSTSPSITTRTTSDDVENTNINKTTLSNPNKRVDTTKDLFKSFNDINLLNMKNNTAPFGVKIINIYSSTITTLFKNLNMTKDIHNNAFINSYVPSIKANTTLDDVINAYTYSTTHSNSNKIKDTIKDLTHISNNVNKVSIETNMAPYNLKNISIDTTTRTISDVTIVKDFQVTSTNSNTGLSIKKNDTLGKTGNNTFSTIPSIFNEKVATAKGLAELSKNINNVNIKTDSTLYNAINISTVDTSSNEESTTANDIFDSSNAFNDKSNVTAESDPSPDDENGNSLNVYRQKYYRTSFINIDKDDNSETYKLTIKIGQDYFVSFGAFATVISLGILSLLCCVFSGCCSPFCRNSQNKCIQHCHPIRCHHTQNGKQNHRRCMKSNSRNHYASKRQHKAHVRFDGK